MPRSVDFRAKPLTQYNLITAWDRLFAELSYVAGYAVGSGDYPQWTGLHYGGDINNAIDRVDAMINSAAVLMGKASPGNALRVEDFRTGTHDVARLHAELDRLHKRIEVIAGRTVVDKIHPNRPFILARTGPATYLSPDGQLRTAGDGEARIGFARPVARRNLFNNSVFNGAAGWDSTNSAILSVAYHDSLPAGYPDSLGYGKGNAIKMTIAGGQFAGNLAGNVSLKAGETVTFSGALYVPSSASGAYWRLTIANSAYSPVASVDIAERDRWVAKEVSYTATADGTYRLWFGSIGDAVGGNYILVAEPQWEKSATKTPYQPTNATGPDYSHPLLGGGLVLEGEGENLASNVNGRPSTMTAAGTTPPTVTLISDATNPFGSQSWRIDFPAGASTGYSGSRAVTGHLVYFSGPRLSTSIWIKGDMANLRFYTFNGGSSNMVPSGARIGDWVEYVGGADPSAGYLYPAVYVVTPPGAPQTIYVAAQQIEASPFRTSWMGDEGIRRRDRVGIVYPHNLLRWSEDLTQSAWLKDANCAISKSGASNLVNFTSASNNGFWQVVAPRAAGPTTYAIRLKLGTLASGQLNILIQRASDSSMIASKTIDVSSLSASSDQTQYLTFTPPGEAIKLILWCSTTGTIYVSNARFVEGHHPGIYVPTTDTPILPPPSPALDPAWSQNGAVEFDVVLPPISQGLGYYIFGYSELSLERYHGWGANVYAIMVNREADVPGSVGPGGFNDVATPNIWGGPRHRIRFEWTHEIRESDGKLEMWKRLYVDGDLYYAKDVAALLGARKWKPIDPSRLISDGGVNAVISGPEDGGVIITRPAPRSGYRQVT